jgi:hypothetical protein
MGVQLFRGRLHKCNDLAAPNFRECLGVAYGGHPSLDCDFMDPKHPNGTVCENPVGLFLRQKILTPRVWETPAENFENLASAAVSILRLLAMDNMTPIFHSVMDIPRNTDSVCPDGSDGGHGCANDADAYTVTNQPRPNNGAANVLFPIVFIFIANAFLSQLVIGVLVDNIRRQVGPFPTEKDLSR